MTELVLDGKRLLAKQFLGTVLDMEVDQSEQEYYELLVNSESVFKTLQYQGQHRLTDGDNLLLMGRYKKGKFEHSMFGSLTDINIWDSILSLEEIKQWKGFSPNIRGDVLTHFGWLMC